MSGFVAVINADGSPVDGALLSALTHSMTVRGPDRQKVWAEGAVGLGHTLFRTTHEAQYENQPASLGGDVWITGCIRVDGRKALIRKLKLDIALDKTPDSELVLQAYRAWGENCLEQLLGDFAFVIWDGPRQKLFCARDRFGMRQLYHARTPQGVVISNSLATMRQHPAVSDDLNDQAIGDFLLFGDHIWTDKTQTAFEGIKTLQPAHQLTLSDGEASITRYWDLPSDIPLLKYRREEEYLEHFQSVFSQAVEDRLRCDDVVISMSGGMDSSAIAATATSIRRKGGVNFGLQALTIVYDDLHPCEERYYASLVAEHLDLPIHYLVADQHPLLAPAVQWTRPMEHYQPSLWVEFNRQALQFGRVMLTGSAGDNLLHYSPALPTWAEANPLQTLRQIIQLKARYGRMPGLGTGLMARVRKMTGKTAARPPPYPYPYWINKGIEQKLGLCQRWDAQWTLGVADENRLPRHPSLIDTLLSPDWNNDDLGMQGGIASPEIRDPYLDLRLVEFVLSLPPMPWLYKKHILREVMRSALPDTVIERPKQALGMLASSLTGQARVNDYLQNKVLDNYVDKAAFRTAAATRDRPDMDYVNLRPLILGQWLQQLESTEPLIKR
ncbi:MAG: asparagine synthase-related protein [Halioglobus sp.]